MIHSKVHPTYSISRRPTLEKQESRSFRVFKLWMEMQSDFLYAVYLFTKFNGFCWMGSPDR